MQRNNESREAVGEGEDEREEEDSSLSMCAGGGEDRDEVFIERGIVVAHSCFKSNSRSKRNTFLCSYISSSFHPYHRKLATSRKPHVFFVYKLHVLFAHVIHLE